jgi:ATP-binding cassette subfamily F protein uup
MDRLVDHLLVMEGNGVIRDFPGNYTQYREWQRNNDEGDAFPNEQPPVKTAGTTTPSSSLAPTARRQLSYKEKREFENLEQEIARLTREKQEVTAQLNSGAVPFDQLQGLSIRIGEIGQLLDDKEMRWLQLSEFAN